MEHSYLKVGKKITIDGQDYYSRDYYDSGLSFGTFFKDEQAFNEDPDAVCYIPEYGFDNELGTGDDEPETKTIDGEKFYPIDLISGYTRKDLEALVEGEVDCEGEPIEVEWFFNELTWMCPETRLYEIDC